METDETAAQEPSTRKPFRPRARPGTLEEAHVALANLRKTIEMSANGRAHVPQPMIGPDGPVDAIPGDPYKIPGDPYKMPDVPAEPFRAKNAKSLDRDTTKVLSDIGDRIASNHAEQAERLEKLFDKLSMTITGSGAPVAAVGSAREPDRRGLSPQKIAEQMAETPRFQTLNSRIMENGDMSFSVPMDFVRDSVAKLAKIDTEAFREVGAASKSPVIKVTGTSDRSLDAAMVYAAHRWNGDPVMIRAADKDIERVVNAAVRAGLAIETGHDPKLAALVERERASVGKVRDAFSQEVASISRVVAPADLSHNR
jgi:hypothetical protein